MLNNSDLSQELTLAHRPRDNNLFSRSTCLQLSIRLKHEHFPYLLHVSKINAYARRRLGAITEITQNVYKGCLSSFFCKSLRAFKFSCRHLTRYLEIIMKAFQVISSAAAIMLAVVSAVNATPASGIVPEPDWYVQ